MENCPPSPSIPLTPGRKRRSWFEPGTSLSYSIAVEQPTVSIPVTPPDAEIDILTLSHFATPPRIDFGEFRTKKEKCRYLKVKNPEEFEQKVLIERFPYKKGFSINMEKFVVPPEDEVLLTIKWIPQEACNCREMILMRVDGVYRLQAYVFGRVTDPPKPKKRKAIGNRGTRKPFGMIQSDKVNVQVTTATAELPMPKRVPFAVNNSSNVAEIPGDLPTGDFKGFETVILHKNDPNIPDTPTRRATFIKDAENLAFPNTPTRRATFKKDDPDLPVTPLRRTTFMKDHSPLPNTPVIDSPKHLSLAARNSPSHRKLFLPSSPQIDEEIAFESSSGSLHLDDLSFVRRPSHVQRESLLNDVSQSPQLLENRLKSLLETPEVFKRKSPELVVSPVASNYCTAFTTPYRSPENASEDENEVFEESLMFLAEKEEKEMAVMEEAVHRVREQEDLVMETEIIGEELEMEEFQEVSTKINTTKFVVVDTKTKVTRQKQSHVDFEIVTTETEKILKFTPTKNRPNVGSDSSPSVMDFVMEQKFPYFDISMNCDNSMVVSTPMIPADQKKQSLTKSHAPSPIHINQETVTKLRLSSDEASSLNVSQNSKQDPFSETPARRVRRRVSSQTFSKPTSVDDLRRLSQISATSPSELLIDDSATHSINVSLPAQEDITHIAFPMPETTELFPIHVNPSQTIPSKAAPVSNMKKRRSISSSKQDLKNKVSKTAPPCNKKRRSLEGKAQDAPTKDSAGAKLTRTQMLRRAVALGKPLPKAAGDKKNVTKTIRRLSGGRKSPHKSAKPAVPSRLLLLKKKQTTALPKHPLPYAAKNMYYDERWLEKQEKGFVTWLNFVLTPPDEHVEAQKPKKINARALCLEAPETRNPHLAPTKEVLSFKAYSAKKKLNRLRRAACNLFQSEACVHVTEKLEREITCGRIMVRPDRKIHMDLGIKQKILELMLSYNPLWLRMGLETVYGELIPLHNNADVMSLSRFIVTRLLSDPDIEAEYSHPSVPHLFKEGYDVAMGKFTLKKFLLMVYFMDLAKGARLIDHDPCLFCKNSDIKTSREVLITFAKEFLRGEGDITRHLSYLGYSVSHVQTALDEFDFAVNNLATDLRDGIRITRVIEMLTSSWSLHTSLRVPAISRLQKVHNVGLAMKALAKKGVTVDTVKGAKIEARDLVDGHREKTHALLWSIIFNFQVEFMLNEAQLRQEVDFLQQNLHLRTRMAALDASIVDVAALGLPRDKRESLDSGVYFKSRTLSLLLKWSAFVCAHYGLKVENFTVSFSDGRALCYLLHHYHPSLLPLDAIHEDTTLSCHMERTSSGSSNSDGEEDSFIENWTHTVSPNQKEKMDQLLVNEKSNFKVLYEKISELGGIPFMVKFSDMSNTIPDEKVVITFVSYLCARLLDLRDETRAARKIQAWWRERKLQVNIKSYKDRSRAVLVLQRAVRRFLVKRREDRLALAAVIVQRLWRWRRMERRINESIAKKRFFKENHSAIVIQGAVRRYLHRIRTVHQHQAAIRIQCTWRQYLCRRKFLVLREVTLTIQRRYRASLVARRMRFEFVLQRSAALVIQSGVRAYLGKRNQAALKIQSWFRARRARGNFLEKRNSVIVLQSVYRGIRAQRDFKVLRSVVVCLQRRIRANQSARRERQNFVQLRNAAVVIQRAYRKRMLDLEEWEREEAAMVIQRAYRRWFSAWKFQEKCQAAVVIQSAFRRHLAQKSYAQQINAIVTIQSWVRMVLVKTRVAEEMEAAYILQRYWRAALIGHRQKQSYQKLRSAVIALQRGFRHKRECREKAAVQIQAAYRMLAARRAFLDRRNAAVAIQAWYRAVREQQQYSSMQMAAILIQHKWRAVRDGRLKRMEFLKTQKAVVLIQSVYRMHVLCKGYQSKRQAAITIQKMVRCRQAKQAFGDLKETTLKVQRRWRCLLQAREIRKGFLTLRRSVLRMQSLYRQRREVECRQKRAALAIQSAFRMYRARRAFLTQKRAAIVIQRELRRVRCQTDYMHTVACVRKLQQYFRSYQQMKEDRAKFVRVKHAACFIQATFKMNIARQNFLQQKAVAVQIQSWFRCRITRKRYEALKRGTLLLQRKFRAHKLMEDHRRRFLNLRKAASLIQRTYRAKQQKRQAYLTTRSAAIQIQAAYRMHQQRQAYLTTRSAAIQIQTAYRMHQQRQAYLTTRSAAIQIQAAYRMHQQRQAYLTTRSAAIQIQAAYRRHQQRQAYLTTRSAAIQIQAAYRMHQQRQAYLTTRSAAIQIQAAYRMHQQRQAYLTTRSAAIQIQTAYRMHQQRHAYLTTRSAAIQIQAAYRRHQQRQAYLTTRSAAIQIQAAYRMHQHRQAYLTTRSAAIQIQAAYRRHQQCQAYLTTRSAAIQIQAAYRMHQQRQAYLTTRSAAIQIQAAYRRHQQRQAYLTTRSAAIQIQAAYRMHQQRQAYLTTRSAAIQIQAAYRMHQQRQAYLTTRSAAIQIQAAYRMHQQRQAYLTTRSAAIQIQAVYRMHQQRQAYLTTRSAAIQIQAAYRMHQQRQAYLTTRSAAIQIQAAYRMHQQRQAYLTTRSAAIQIQAVYRMHQQRQAYLTTRSAAIQIQAAYRMHQQRQAYLTTRSAAIQIQSFMRMLLARSQFIRQKRSVVVLQRHFTGLLLMKTMRERFICKKTSAIVIQRAYRNYLLRRNDKRRQAAVRLQTAWRAYTLRKRTNACIVIQRRFRAMKLARIQQLYFHVIRGAAIVLQSFFRAIMAKKLAKRMKAAVCIQRTYKGFVARREFLLKRSQIVLLQSLVRREQERRRFLKIRSAVIVMQAQWRAVRIGRHERRCFLIRKGAAITLQAWFKGQRLHRDYLIMRNGFIRLQALHRRNIESQKFSELRDSVIKMQRRRRAISAGREDRQRFLRLRHAATCVQNLFRVKQAQREASAIRKQRHAAAVKVQSAVRGLLARRHFSKRNVAALMIQRRWRAVRDGRLVRREQLMRTAATMVIQNAWRKTSAQRRYQRLRQAAIRVQSLCKAKKQRLEFCKSRASAVTIQRWFRTVLHTRQCRSAYEQKKQAVVIVQRAYRARLQQRTAAVVCIQSHMRSWKQRENYLRLRHSAVLIQRMYRGYKERIRYNALKNAALVLQRLWRCNTAAKKQRLAYLTQKRAAISIQAWFKMHSARSAFRSQKVGFAKLSAVIRGRRQRKRFVALKRAAIVIQQRWRAEKLCQKKRGEFLLRRTAAVSLQAIFRGMLVRRQTRRVRAAVSIQSFWRMFRARENYKVEKMLIQAAVKSRHQYQVKISAATSIQWWFRSKMLLKQTRKDFLSKKRAVIIIQKAYLAYKLRRNEAATRIQACFRRFAACKKYQHTRASVVQAQSFVRGYLAKKKLRDLRMKWHAALAIQRAFRRHQIKTKLKLENTRRSEYLQRYCCVVRYHLMAVRIQRAWHKKQSIVLAQKHLSSVIVIQRWLKTILVRAKFLRQLAAVRVVQKAKKRDAACILQTAVRRWLAKKQEEKFTEAALLIQSHWRGRKVRRASTSKALRNIRKQVLEANRKATVDQRLGNRMRRAVDNLFKYKQLAYVLQAVMDIDVATRFSHVCCRELVEHGAVPVIFRLIRSCNRSVPHMEIVKYSVNVLLNLAKYEETRGAVYQEEGSIDCLIELLQIYREKGAIFTKVCTLLGVLCYDPQSRKEVFENKKVVEKLNSLHKLTSRKHKMNKDRKTVQNKMAASRSLSSTMPIMAPVVKTPRVSPDWVLSKNKMQEIEDPMAAINFVMDTLRLR
ncbi:hypothetical protein CAPTEDRAFT_220529 [Capitella teleta]|uniref:Calponin-homology (CH) domain-containing protein n=1 Tax=Capitella teleta TaxID=283909 RepID=R7TU08_CAPTE|nr:hypothetical protein CAPTEDRAFT_220529 [Capitella teleta]|eukprot:ELT97378.1 hypothetical protein CAPTEDRAFT_220529 [Capitella teleta]